MQRISAKSCYYYYDRQWDNWDQLRENFSWEIPQKMNAAFYVCDVHADDPNRVAIFHEDFTGAKGTITFRQLQQVTNQLANYLIQK